MALVATNLSEYELEREERIRRNKARIDELGLMKQTTLLQACFRSVKRPRQDCHRKVVKEALAEPIRRSGRLQGVKIDYKELPENPEEGCSVPGYLGRVALPKAGVVANDEAWSKLIKERRCDSKSRGSIYDTVAGITCHFCRQKKLCGEEGCPRCSARDVSQACIGKSECTKCGTANGRFCRACLLVRYGLELEDVRSQMQAGEWLCPHCYEEEHPESGWICNSSICMTRRGLRPTGIAIFEAQQRGFPSVAHYVQAQMAEKKRCECAAATCQAQPATDGASATEAGAAAPAAEPNTAAEADAAAILSQLAVPAQQQRRSGRRRGLADAESVPVAVEDLPLAGRALRVRKQAAAAS